MAGDDDNRARDQAIEDLDAFTYSVSHDLRFPLRVIDGYTRALEEDCGAMLDEQGKSYMTSIRGGVERMEKMIASLVELARVSRSPERGPVDLSALARSVLAEIRRKSDREVTVEIADGLAGEGDRSMLEVVFENLLGNAWKFTGQNPAARIEVGKTPEGAVFVRDNGAGFDSTRADRIFSPFRRFHTPDQFPGTGVGLAMAHRVIVRHGGRIWAEAAIGTGATFYFTLA